MRLATFVHISDLHFGLIGPDSFDASASKLWAKLPHLDGLLGHSYRSLKRLREFFVKMHQTEDDARLIVTGDLTTKGNSVEFETADEYLGGILRPPKGKFIGLRVRGWRDLAIPGNHDHWPGAATIFGPPTAALHRDFPGLPKVEPVLKLSTGHLLRFVRIDSDADVWPWGRNRLYAVGKFAKQLTHLDQALDVPAPKEIRVLCLHHSRGWTEKILRIEQTSHKLLDRFIGDHNIAVLLCGHIHEAPLVKTFPLTHKGQKVECLEARCGTTTQRDPPYEWRTLLGRPYPPRQVPNSLLVHRVLELDGAIHWETEVYYEGLRFDRIGSLPGKKPATKRVKVWPRP